MLCALKTYKINSVMFAVDIGRTRTIPSNDTELSSWRLAFASNKQYPHGFFNNLGDIAERDDLDMMVWLGDYIYEYPYSALVNGMLLISIDCFPN